MSINSSTEQLQKLTFQLRSIEKVVFRTDQLYEVSSNDEHVMLVCVKGSGKLYTDEEVLWISTLSTFMFSPGKACQIKNRSAMECYEIRYVVLDTASSTAPVFVQQALFTHTSELKILHAQQLIDMTKSIFQAGAANLQTAIFHKNIEFIKLIAFIMNQQLVLEGEGGLITAVERSIYYLQENYTSKITVHELEKELKLANGQYSVIFRELTGKKPLDYMTDLRIKHSKRLLLESNQSLREIAEQVGFKDEYYFNRKFRQVTGMPPRKYADTVKNKIVIKDFSGREVTLPEKPSRIVFYGATMEDILVLGIQPVGGGLCLRDPYFDIMTVSLLKPDLIIIDMENEAVLQRFSSIAPTVVYNSFTTLESRLKQLGAWLGKEQEAEAWLSQYRKSIQELWKGTSHYKVKGKTASVFIFHRGKLLFVMGNIGLTTILYHEQGFACPPPIQKLLDEQLAYKEISVEQLQQYVGDVVFMLRPSSPLSREAMYELLELPVWKALQAEGKELHIIDELFWNCNDAMTLSKVVQELPSLLNE